MPRYRRYPYGTFQKSKKKKSKTTNVFNIPHKACTKVHNIYITRS